MSSQIAKKQEGTVYVVDDDPAMRDALKSLICSAGFSTFCFASVHEFLQFNTVHLPACLILDLRMPGASGLELQAMLKERKGSALPVIFLSGHGNVVAAVRAIRAGALDFLTKPLEGELLIRKVNEALAGHRSQESSRRKLEYLKSCIASLTPREHEVFEGVANGQSSKAIAQDLGISPKTVELHRAHMMEKMQANSIAELVHFYLAAEDENLPQQK